MPRVSIALPERFTFATEFPLHASHINQADHLDNVQLLLLVAEARTRFTRPWGPLRPDGARIVIADTAVQYRGEAFYGDVLRIRMAPQDVQRCGFDLVFDVREIASDRMVASGKLGIVFVDIATNRAREILPRVLPWLRAPTPLTEDLPPPPRHATSVT